MSKRSDWRGVSRGGIVGLVLGLGFLAVIFVTLTAALAGVPGMPVWAILVPAVAALAAVCAATAAAAAWLMEVPEHKRGGAGLAASLPPVRHAGRYAADPRDWKTLTWHQPGPDRPSADRPRPGLTWDCPVVPGKPRTVRDLREGPPVNLRSWE